MRRCLALIIGLVSGVLVVVMGLLMLRPAKALMVALQYAHRRDEMEKGE